MKEVWQHIETWLKAHNPELLKGINPGATEEQVRHLEEALGVKFPEPFRSSTLIHDGQDENLPGLINDWDLLSLHRIKAEWELWKELLDGGEFSDYQSQPEAGVKNNWWNERWIPIAGDGAGNFLCLDLDPAPGGDVGQIITMWHDDAERVIIAQSFKDWLGTFAAGLESRKSSSQDKVSKRSPVPTPDTPFPASELRQKFLNERKDFFLEPQRIRLVTKDVDGHFEAFVRYEIVTPQHRSYTRQDGRVYIAAISFGIFGLIGLGLNLLGEDTLMRWSPLWLMASLVLWGFHIYKRRHYLLVDLGDKKQIFFLHNKPSKEKFEKFLEELYSAQRHYLRSRYLQILPGSSEADEIAKLRWLRHKEAITEDELQQMIAYTKDHFVPTKE